MRRLKRIFSLFSARDSLLDYNLENRKKRFFNQSGSSGPRLNIGSGPSPVEGFINIDVKPYRGVEVVCDVCALSFKDGVIEAIILDHVLEYIQNPFKAAEEVWRVLKEGGVIYVSSAFIYPWHPKPRDNFRFSLSGLEILFSKFKILEKGKAKGPTSVFLSIFVYWLAYLFSLGNRTVFKILRSILIYLFFPLKYLDRILVKSGFEDFAIFSNVYIVGRK